MYSLNSYTQANSHVMSITKKSVVRNQLSPLRQFTKIRHSVASQPNQFCKINKVSVISGMCYKCQDIRCSWVRLLTVLYYKNCFFKHSLTFKRTLASQSF